MKHDYYLMYKVAKRNFANYKGDAVRISEIVPKTYDEVWVGVKKHPEKARRITTFRDEQGNIIERAFDYSDSKLRNRVYRHRTLNIGDNETVHSTTIKDYFIRKRVIPFYEDLLEEYAEIHPMKNILWNLTDIITNHVSKNKQTNEIILSQVKVNNIQTPTKENHSFTEFPTKGVKGVKRGAKGEKQAVKFLKFVVNSLTGKIRPNTIEAQGVLVPKKDSYLAQRALPIDSAKIPFTERFIRDRKLQKAKIEINPEYYPMNEDDELFAAYFEPLDGSVNYNRFFRPYSKTRLAGIAKHETEHAWQYYLRSRISEATTEWEKFIKEQFGKIKDKKLKKEARKYAKSIRQYVALTKELEDAGRVEEYKNNYIEIKAQEAAAKARKEYDKQGKIIRNNFKHIPVEYM